MAPFPLLTIPEDEIVVQRDTLQTNMSMVSHHVARSSPPPGSGSLTAVLVRSFETIEQMPGSTRDPSFHGSFPVVAHVAMESKHRCVMLLDALALT